MIYKSNLEAPDLSRFFKHLTVSPMAHSFGHDVPRDWADKSDDDPVFGIWKRCGFWTHDEAAILYNVAKRLDGVRWVDIGAHTGWTSLHVMVAHSYYPYPVDYMHGLREFRDRFSDNMGLDRNGYLGAGIKSDAYFKEKRRAGEFADGFIIDGDHDRPQPLQDAIHACDHLANNGVIMLHDFSGEPVQEAVTWLRNQGFKSRIYFTPQMVACCWVGDFVPPDHIPDPNLPDLKARCPNFDWSRVQ